MGITIHFRGRLKSESDFHSVTAKGRGFAERVGSEVLILDSPKKTLLRFKGEELYEYEGPVKGILFQPHPNSEPIVLEFDRDNFLQEFCKTQYAGIATHIAVIKFLKDIERHFESFTVVDEGGFWENEDIRGLEKKF